MLDIERSKAFPKILWKNMISSVEEEEEKREKKLRGENAAFFSMRKKRN